MPSLDEFLDSSENGLSVHLDVWDEAKCPTSSIVVEQRWQFLNETKLLKKSFLFKGNGEMKIGKWWENRIGLQGCELARACMSPT